MYGQFSTAGSHVKTTAATVQNHDVVTPQIMEVTPLKTSDVARNAMREQTRLAREANPIGRGSSRAPIQATILSEGFEGTTGTNIPTGWERYGSHTGAITATTNGAWMTAAAVTGIPRGDRNALINLNGNNEANWGVLETPYLTLTAGTVYEIEFWLFWNVGAGSTHLDNLLVNVTKGMLGGVEDSIVSRPLIIGAFTDRTHPMPQQTLTRFVATFTVPVTGDDYFIDFTAGNSRAWGATTGRGGNIRIDDIRISGLTARNNDIAFLPYAFPMTQVPTSQTIMPLTSQVRNIGVNAQTGVQVSATNNGTAIGTSATEPTLAPGATQTFTITPTAKFTSGANAFALTATQTETDEDLTDNVVNFTVTGTENIFATDDGEGFWLTGSDQGIVRSGNIFVVTEPVTLEQVSMRFGQTVTALAFNLRLFEVTNLATLTIAATPMFTEALNRSSFTSGQWINVTVPITVLQPGAYYLETEESSAAVNLGLLASAAGADGIRSYQRESATATALTVRSAFGGQLMRLVVNSGDIPVAVATLTPANNATNVAVDAQVKVTFNQDVTAGTLTGITISPDPGGVSASVVGRDLIIAHDDFEEGTLYTVNIPVGAIEDYTNVISWTFTTAHPGDFTDPYDVSVTITGATTARMTWKHGPPDPMITLVAGDVWEDGSGYQMWIDATARPVDDLLAGIPATCAIPAEIPNRFAYRIPENATFACNSPGIVFNGNATIQIPAGVYSYLMITPDVTRVWIANRAGASVGAREGVTFEAGKHYTYTVTLVGTNDFVTLVVTDIAKSSPIPAESFNIFLDGEQVANVTQMEHVFTGLTPGSYTAGVQAVGPGGILSNIITYGFTVAETSITPLMADMIAVYPNPADDVLFIETAETVTRVEIYDLNGRLVRTVAGDAREVSVRDLSAGTYVIRITTTNGTITQRFVKK
jgi:hypothetical protein